MRDMFGQELSLQEAERSMRKRTSPVPRGYAAPPGSGPAGETCKTCQHIVRFKRYRKCGKRHSAWTHGGGSDILAKAPACRQWERALPTN